jgi:hypothetical protein
MYVSVDLPIVDPSQDALGRHRFVETLSKALVEETKDANGISIGHKSTGYVVGLTGEWGSGKSSVLNLVANYLERKSGIIVVNFNPWIFRGHDDLLDGFFNELKSQIGKTTRQKLRDVAGFFDKYRDAIAAGAAAALHSAAPGTGLVSTAVNSAIPRLRPTSVIESKVALEEKIAQSEIAVVVLIDELDRVEDEEVRAVARLIKSIGQIKGLSYLVAYDPERVAEALGRGIGNEQRQSGEYYLEKIIQLNIPLRPLLDYEKINLLINALKAKGYSTFGDGLKEGGLFEILAKLLPTPRDVKRVIDTFSAIEPMVRGEINALDVLGYSYLVAKAPGIRTAIARDPNAVVDDPTDDEVFARARGSRRTVESLFGKDGERHSAILTWLFPYLNQAQRHGFDRDKIRKRRNLIRLLYLGNPPELVSRSEIEKLYRLDQSSALLEFRKLIAEMRFIPVVDRFIDVHPFMDETKDKTIWLALTKALERDHDWLTCPEPQRMAIPELEELLRTNSADDFARQRSQAIVDTLVTAGEFQIIPMLLANHVLHFGLGTGALPDNSNFSAIFSSDDTMALLRRTIPQYKAEIKSGFALKRLLDPNLFFLLLRMNSFDEDLRNALTGQLTNIESLATFSWLITPRGHNIARETLDRIVDIDALLPRFRRTIESDELSKLPTEVRESLESLYATADRG